MSLPTLIGAAAEESLRSQKLVVQSIQPGVYVISGPVWLLANSGTLATSVDTISSWADATHVKWRFFDFKGGAICFATLPTRSYIASINPITAVSNALVSNVQTGKPTVTALNTPSWVMQTTCGIVSGSPNGIQSSPYNSGPPLLVAPTVVRWWDKSRSATAAFTTNLAVATNDIVFDVVSPSQGTFFGTANALTANAPFVPGNYDANTFIGMQIDHAQPWALWAPDFLPFPGIPGYYFFMMGYNGNPGFAANAITSVTQAAVASSGMTVLLLMGPIWGEGTANVGGQGPTVWAAMNSPAIGTSAFTAGVFNTTGIAIGVLPFSSGPETIFISPATNGNLMAIIDPGVYLRSSQQLTGAASRAS
jgi:hypothetical protein